MRQEVDRREYVGGIDFTRKLKPVMPQKELDKETAARGKEPRWPMKTIPAKAMTYCNRYMAMMGPASQHCSRTSPHTQRGVPFSSGSWLTGLFPWPSLNGRVTARKFSATVNTDVVTLGGLISPFISGSTKSSSTAIVLCNCTHSQLKEALSSKHKESQQNGNLSKIAIQ